jgi:hypothetical protein
MIEYFKEVCGIYSIMGYLLVQGHYKPSSSAASA